MDGTNIQQKIEQLRASIFEAIKHRTLLQYTGNPYIKENHLFYILLPFLNGEVLNDEQYEGAVTVGIIHASLEEHEKIDENNATSKIQQLTVLSGDYFSGKYYEILANSGNIPFIRELSKSILSKCEYQMKVYEQDNPTVPEWIDILSSIESIVIECYYKFYGHTSYDRIMKIALLIRRLQEELHGFEQGKESTFMIKMNAANKGTGNNKTLEAIIQREIDTLKSNLQAVLDSSNLKDDLKQYIIGQVAHS